MIGVMVVKQTNGTAVEHLAHELAGRLDVELVPDDLGWHFKLDAPSRDEAISRCQHELDDLSDSWPIHLKLDAA